MKIEKLRKSHKNKLIVGGLINLGVIGTIAIFPSFAKYKLTESINIANGVVNYKVPDLKVMAMYQQNESGEYDEITTMPNSGYIINEEKTYCTIDNVNQVKGKAYTNPLGELVFKNLTKSDKCYLYFDKKRTTSEDKINDLGIIANTTAPTFKNIATTDEGVFQTHDGMYGGNSYYWRGTAKTNHVIFANKCWRIVRINGDGSIRLIYNGTPNGTTPNQTCPDNGSNSSTVIIGSTNSEKYYATSDGKYNNSSYVGWTYKLNSQRPDDNATGTASNAKVQTEKWYQTNIIDTGFDDKVAEGLFCNDRRIQDDETWRATGTTQYYAGRKRLYIDYAPTLDCSKAEGKNDIYKLKVGAITADEVIMAGGKDTNNTAYYLYNGQNYWTMSPFDWDSNRALVFIVNSNGFLAYGYINDNYIVLRPVINLKADTQFSNGNGTLNAHFIVTN